MKFTRHAKILEIIKREDIGTQEELSEALKNEGFTVTQATVSRDIKEMRLIKVPGKSGVYKYASIHETEGVVSERFTRIFKNSVVSIESAGNIIVIKTLVGAANAAAVSIDALSFEEILGTIAGDDTIFLVIRSEAWVPKIIQSFEKLLE